MSKLGLTDQGFKAVLALLSFAPNKLTAMAKLIGRKPD